MDRLASPNGMFWNGVNIFQYCIIVAPVFSRHNGLSQIPRFRHVLLWHYSGTVRLHGAALVAVRKQRVDRQTEFFLGLNGMYIG